MLGTDQSGLAEPDQARPGLSGLTKLGSGLVQARPGLVRTVLCTVQCTAQSSLLFIFSIANKFLKIN